MSDSAVPSPSPSPAAEPAPPAAAAATFAMPPVDGSLLARMGIEVTHVDADGATGTMPVAGNTQPYGLLHGGASAVLAETLGSFAAQAHAGPGRAAVGIELSATHHRSARSGVVTGRATALHRGRTLATYEVVVEDPEGRRVCTARLTCMLIERT